MPLDSEALPAPATATTADVESTNDDRADTLEPAPATSTADSFAPAMPELPPLPPKLQSVMFNGIEMRSKPCRGEHGFDADQLRDALKAWEAADKTPERQAMRKARQREQIARKRPSTAVDSARRVSQRAESAQQRQRDAGAPLLRTPFRALACACPLHSRTLRARGRMLTRARKLCSRARTSAHPNMHPATSLARVHD